MSTLTIRNVEAALKERLRVRAAHNGRSMEAELRQILQDTLTAEKSDELDLAAAIRRRFLPFGGVDDLIAHPHVEAGDPVKLEP